MTSAKNVYVLLLALIIVLSGCFGATTEDSDAQDSGENSGGTGTTFTGADNLPPVISVSVLSSSEFYEGEDCTTAGISVSARHAMTDWDGTIQQAGWDIDLDGTIDYSVTADEGYTTLQMPMSAMIWYNTSAFGEPADPFYDSGYAYLQNSIAFGAQDDDGEFVSSEIIMIQERAYYQSYGSDLDITNYMDNEPCRDFSDPTDYNFSYADNPDILGGQSDYLVDITRTNGQAAISWEAINIHFDGNGGDHASCNYNSNQGCLIIQDGGQDDSMWEPGEMITIRELGENLHYAGGESQTATITIMLLDEGSNNDFTTMDVHALTVN